MKLSKIYSVYFSPVRNTRMVAMETAKNLAQQLGLDVEAVDFTTPAARRKEWEFEEDALVVFATPTYAGRIPNKILPFVQTLFKGNDTPAIALVTFGNRSFDNSLIELKNELSCHGFLPIGAAAIACRHSFTDLLAGDRPDKEDRSGLEGFVSDIAELINRAGTKEELPFNLEVPGEDPPQAYYVPLGIDGKPVQFLKAKPKTREEDCDHCGLCAAKCPMEAIDFQDETKVSGTCIKCQACVRLCHTNAKYFDDENFLSHVKMLEENFVRRAESQFFIGSYYES